MATNSARDVAVALGVNGPLSAAELAARLGVSQPTISRALSALGSVVLRIGRGRSTRYALRQQIARAPAVDKSLLLTCDE